MVVALRLSIQLHLACDVVPAGWRALSWELFWRRSGRLASVIYPVLPLHHFKTTPKIIGQCCVPAVAVQALEKLPSDQP